MYDYGYGYGYPDVSATSSLVGGIIAMIGGILLVSAILAIIMIISQWMIFKKAGKKGWEAIIPIYNFVVLLEIVGLPLWYIALFFVPIANIYAMFKIYIELAHKFNKSTGFGVLTVFFSFICLPILAFGKNNIYNGNNTQNMQNNNMNVNQNNNMNNTTNVNTQNEPQPLVFDQNVNTEINNIASQNMNNDINSQMNTIQQPDLNQTLVFNTSSLVENKEPISTQPIANMPMNSLNNSVNQPIANNTESVNAFMPTQPVANQEPALNIIPNVEPTSNQPIENIPTNSMNNPVNQPIANNTESVNAFMPTQPVANQEPALNIIPNVEPTSNQPMQGQNNNSQNN